VQVTCPDGRTLLAGIQTTANEVEWNFDDTKLSGIYSVSGFPNAQSRQFAVNIDTLESDLARIDAGSLPPKIAVESQLQNETDGSATSNLITQAAWSRPLLWSALAVMFLESLVAWRFGRSSA
jgi:hypothetical protein